MQFESWKWFDDLDFSSIYGVVVYMYACLVTYIARCTLSPNSNPFRQRHRRAFKLVSITIRERERDYFPIFFVDYFSISMFLVQIEFLF